MSTDTVSDEKGHVVFHIDTGGFLSFDWQPGDRILLVGTRHTWRDTKRVRWEFDTPQKVFVPNPFKGRKFLVRNGKRYVLKDYDGTLR